MSGNYPDPEVWPDNDPDSYPLSKVDQARDVLDDQEFHEWMIQTGRAKR